MKNKEDVRKILYSPGYGAGWVSWAHCGLDQKRFMLEYQPFIDFLEAGNEFKDGNSPDDYKDIPVVQQFMKDWDATFPECAGDYPFMGGLRDLEVYEVPAGSLVRVTDYDGYEKIEILGTVEGWL
jgi:hypothetical protein